MSEVVSVILSDLFERNLQRTVEDLKAKAAGPVEIGILRDDQSLGMRFNLNRLAERAKGRYLFKLDGHCILSEGWDEKLKEVCADEKDMAVCRIRAIDEKQWALTEDGFAFVTMNPDLSIVACGDFTADDPDTAETMASIGCGWMIHRSRFMDLEMNWEQLGRYGNLGAEWALKIWLSGGRLLVNRDVTCGHLFRRQGVAGCGIKEQLWARRLLGIRFQQMEGPQQVHPLGWLAERFNKLTQECLT